MYTLYNQYCFVWNFFVRLIILNATYSLQAAEKKL